MEVETMIFPVLKLVRMFSVVCMFHKDFEGERAENKQKADSVHPWNRILCIKYTY